MARFLRRPLRIASAALVLAFGALLLAGNVAAQYKWTDAAGRTVYGDNPPREAKNIQRIDARGATGEADALAGLTFETRRAAQQFPVVLYTTNNCPPCDAGRQLLRARGVPYGERVVSTKEDSDALTKLGHGERLPIMTVGRQVQKEFETTAWHGALDAAGYPRAGQLPRGWTAVAAPLAPRPAAAAAPAQPEQDNPPQADATKN